MVTPLWKLEEVAPPTPYFFDKDDILYVLTRGNKSGLKVGLRLRYILLDGRLQIHHEEMEVSSDRSVKTYHFSLPECFLISLILMSTAGTPKRGNVYAIVGIKRGGIGWQYPSLCFTAGYVDWSHPLVWPPATIGEAAAGMGLMRSIVGTDPAAGNEISETVPTNARWRLISVYFYFSTSAVVGNRTVRLIIDDGANPVWQVNAPIPHPENRIRLYVAGAGFARDAQEASNPMLPLPQGLVLAEGYRIRTDTVGLDTGDTYSAPHLLVEEWIED